MEQIALNLIVSTYSTMSVSRDGLMSKNIVPTAKEKLKLEHNFLKKSKTTIENPISFSVGKQLIHRNFLSKR
jgi:hypothetical protein